MRLRPLGRSGLLVSELSLGTMNFGSDWHGIGAADERAAARLLDAALAAGVNLIDTADVYGYGAAEDLLGRLLKGRRSRVLVATKVLGHMKPGDPESGGLSRLHILAGAEASLQRLRTDRIDLYMPHGFDPAVPLEESLEAFAKLVSDGKVRVLGCANFSGESLRAALDLAGARGGSRFEFDQVQYSLAAREAEGDSIPVCLREEVAVVAWSPLAGGFLTGKYRKGAPRPAGTRRADPANAFPWVAEDRRAGLIEVLVRVAEAQGLTPAQASLRWLLARPGVASVTLGARTVEQLEEDLAAADPADGTAGLSSKSLSLLDRASAVTAGRPGAAAARAA